MIFLSVTRLRVRSFFFMPEFIFYALASARQAERASGFVAGKVLREPKNVFWTMTAWDDEKAMNAYRIHDAHRNAMPKLLAWCDEASVVHWQQKSAELVSWQEAHLRMMKDGRLSKVNVPSAAQIANSIPAPQPSPIERILKPLPAKK